MSEVSMHSRASSTVPSRLCSFSFVPHENRVEQPQDAHFTDESREAQRGSVALLGHRLLLVHGGFTFKLRSI